MVTTRSQSVKTSVKTTKKIQKKRTSTTQKNSASFFQNVFSFLWFWGNNNFGQLGYGEDVGMEYCPKRSNINSKVIDVAAKATHSLVLTEDGDIYSFGLNFDCALGRETAEGGDSQHNEMIPGPVAMPKEAGKPIQIASTNDAGFALTKNGCIYGWGTFRDGRKVIGFSPTTRKQPTPVCVYCPTTKSSAAIKICGGVNHMIALLKDGSALSWGDNSVGQLGRIGIRQSQRESILKKALLTPRRIHSVRGTSFVNVFCAHYGTFLQSSSEEFFACGLNNYGQLSLEPTFRLHDQSEKTLEYKIKTQQTLITPTAVKSLKDLGITQVAAGHYHAMGLNKEGEVFSWGASKHGLLGREDMIPRIEHSIPFPRPGRVSGIKRKVTSLACAPVNSGCIDEDGECYTWGAAMKNILGEDTYSDILVPRKVPRTEDMENKTFHRLVFGSDHAALLGN